jgi:type IV secretion system protein VirB11
MDGIDALEARKKQRLLDNFIDDISPLRAFLDDPGVTDIFIGSSGEIILKIFAEGKRFTGQYVSPSKVRGIILSAAALLDKPLDPVGGIPKLEAVIPRPFNARLTGLLPPWVSSPELTLRKPPNLIFPLEDYVAKARLKPDEYDLICRFIEERKNILIGGGTGSGKSTFANALLKKMVEFTPNDRFYIVEDVPELRCEARDKTQIEVHPKHAAEAVRTALRWTPDRIIFGEVRYGEVANELLKAWNTGHTGNITTIHADSCSSMLLRMEGLLREEIKGTIPNIAGTIHLCVHLAATKNGPLVDEVLPTDEIGSLPRGNNPA